MPSRMTTYTIIPKADQTSFDVAIVGNDGVRQTLLGFETQADAAGVDCMGQAAECRRWPMDVKLSSDPDF